MFHDIKSWCVGSNTAKIQTRKAIISETKQKCKCRKFMAYKQVAVGRLCQHLRLMVHSYKDDLKLVSNRTYIWVLRKNNTMQVNPHASPSHHVMFVSHH